jgi:hypothetical protein
MPIILIRKGKYGDSHREKVNMWHGIRDWSDTSTSQGTQGSPATPQVKRVQEGSFWQLSEGAESCHHLEFGFQDPRTVR